MKKKLEHVMLFEEYLEYLNEEGTSYDSLGLQALDEPQEDIPTDEDEPVEEKPVEEKPAETENEEAVAEPEVEPIVEPDEDETEDGEKPAEEENEEVQPVAEEPAAEPEAATETGDEIPGLNDDEIFEPEPVDGESENEGIELTEYDENFFELLEYCDTDEDIMSLVETFYLDEDAPVNEGVASAVTGAAKAGAKTAKAAGGKALTGAAKAKEVIKKKILALVKWMKGKLAALQTKLQNAKKAKNPVAVQKVQADIANTKKVYSTKLNALRKGSGE